MKLTKRGDAYRYERSEIFNVERVGGRARVTSDDGWRDSTSFIQGAA